VLTENFDADDSEDYKSGFRKGFAVKHIMEGGIDSQKQAKEVLREEVDRMERYYGLQGPKPTDEHWEHWRTLQTQIRRFGHESWQDVLLETYRLLNSYAEGSTLSDSERSAMLRVKEGIVERLAKTMTGL
jgi:hypothetical protein